MTEKQDAPKGKKLTQVQDHIFPNNTVFVESEEPKVHHYYHIQGLTDLSKIRDDAEYRRRKGYMKMRQPSIIHHHKADEDCRFGKVKASSQKHEVFELGSEDVSG